MVGESRLRDAPMHVPKLKWNVVGSFSLRRVAVRSVAEQAELPRYDFSPLAFAASVVGFVLAASQPSFDVDLPVVAQNLIRADGNAGELPGRANAVDFESGKRRRDGYIALFLSRSTRRQRDASLRERTQRTADGFFDCLG
jgi:hypothetical protein